LSLSKGKGLLHQLLFHLHHLHLLLRMWQVHLTTWKKSIGLTGAAQLGVLAGPDRSDRSGAPV
jgi:hypothetical protein